MAKKFLASVSVVPLLYLIGLYFISGYYGFFGVETSEINISVEEIISFSIKAIFAFSTEDEFLCIVIGLVIGTAIVWLFPWLLTAVSGRKQIQTLSTLPTLVILVCFAFLTAVLFNAAQLGRSAAGDNIENLPFVMMLKLPNEPDKIPGESRVWHDWSSLQFLVMTNSHTVLVDYDEDQKTLHTVRLPKDADFAILSRVYK
ncbi:hypothetical protein C8N42_101167 [Celeribacter persicus]|uniref:Uncharacterized protein n=1 Tax=Celeribacter persicus TaxID=1651082 RepID=A0A2T5HVW8_9RHOB|nr:hypothetical protein C8N42_101167 [Celeribacter persicus]